LIHKWNNNLAVRYAGLIPPRPQICQNMYDFGEISLTCLTKYAIFFYILIKKIAKLIQFSRNILQICQNMYDFGKISLTCLIKYAICFFGNDKIMTDN
jgi:hypothetical protein